MKTSLLILSKDRWHLIKPCLESLLSHCNRPEVEVLLGDTGSTDPRVFALYESLGPKFAGRFRVIRLPRYHFSANNNLLAQEAQGRNLVLLNNDTAALGDWLSPLERALEFPSVAVAGAKLLFGHSGRIQHAGAEFMPYGPFAGLAYHPYQGRHPQMPDLLQDRFVPAVTGACLAVRRDEFLALGGLDEIYAEEAQDADYCLRVQAEGKRILWASAAVLYHFENGTRGPLRSENEDDRRLFLSRWKRFVRKKILSHPRQSEPARSPEKPIVYGLIERAEARGDVLATSSVARDLKSKHPNLHLTFRTKYPDLVDSLSFVDRVLAWHEPDTYDYAHRWRPEYEAKTWRASPLTFQNRLRTSVGLAPALDPETLRPLVSLTAEDEKALLSLQEFLAEKPYVVFATGAGWREKEWTKAGWDELSQSLAGRGLEVIQIGGASDCVVAGAHLLWERTLQENFAVVRGAKFVVTLDSFPYHVAAAAGVRTLLLTCKTSSHTLTLFKETRELRNREVVKTPLPGCVAVGCRKKWGDGTENTCPAPILRTLAAREVVQAVEDWL